MTPPVKRRREVEYYHELAAEILVSIQAVLPQSWAASITENTTHPTLPQQVDAICDDLGIARVGTHFPSVRPDIVLGVLSPEKALRLTMFEVKGPASSIGLTDYSQMFGYVHSAELVACGVLLLIEDKIMSTPLSLDLKKVIDGCWLPCHWTFRNLANKVERTYRAGIAYYLEGAHIDWIDLEGSEGISGWSDLVNALVQSEVVLNCSGVE